MSRYGLGKVFSQWDPHPSFSAGTLLANLAGCALMGALAVWIGQLSETYREAVGLFLLTGFLGSLTTFSTYIFEVFRLAQAGGVKMFLTHTAAHLIVGMGGLWLGFSLAQKAWPSEAVI
jgi:fluoride exporter